MSEKNTKVRIWLGTFKFEVEGNEQFITTIMGNNMVEIIENIKPLVVEYSTLQSSVEAIRDDEVQGATQIESGGDIPQLSDVQGLADAIRKLFATSWGKTPRSITEIKEVISLNALHFDTNDIGSALTKMIKKGEIRRIGKKRKNKYVKKINDEWCLPYHLRLN